MLILDKEFAKLSGPVSMTYLEPKIDVFKKINSEGISLSTVMLFGDFHLSKEYGCDCKSIDCTEIYSDKFLSTINELAEVDYVDFYIEGDYDVINEKILKDVVSGKINLNFNKDIDVMYELRDKMLPCYFKVSKYNLCAYPSIRWQYADIRQEQLFKKYNYESQLFSFNREIKNLNDGIYKDLNHFYSIIYTNFDYEDVFNSVNIILDDLKNKTGTFIDKYFDLNNKKFIETSLIYKQINKQKKNTTLSNFNLWKKWIKDYYVMIISETNKNILNQNENQTFMRDTRKYIKLLELKTTFEEFVRAFNSNNLSHFLDLKMYKTLFNDIHNVLINVISIFLDIYFVTRIFKVPEESHNPILTLSYFGDYHCINITKLLTDIMGFYQVKYLVRNEYNNKPGMRCITLPNFNLTEELNKYTVQPLVVYLNYDLLSRKEIYDKSYDDYKLLSSIMTSEKFDSNHVILYNKEYIPIYKLIFTYSNDPNFLNWYLNMNVRVEDDIGFDYLLEKARTLNDQSLIDRIQKAYNAFLNSQIK